MWHDPFAPPDSPDTSFFQYTARLGRHILAGRRAATPAAAEHWRRQGLTQGFLTEFWSRLWDSRQARRISTFQWLVARRGTTVGSWLIFSGHSSACPRCGHLMETQRQCLWDCPQAQQVWLRVLRLLVPLSAEGIFTWGAAAWSTLSGPALAYEAEPGSLAIRLHTGQPRHYPFSGTEPLPTSSERDLRWELLSSLTLWFVWRTRCHRVFEGQLEPPAVTV